MGDLLSERGWRIEQPCPQCGAPVQLRETDRLLTCDYCKVRLHLSPIGRFRYCLPPRRGANDGLVWVPYWRFRGPVFTCVPYEIVSGIVDVTRLATPLAGVPASLGVRPQALTMRFATPEVPGRFLRPAASSVEAVARALDGLPASRDRRPLHRALVDHTLSLVYLPVRADRDLLDAILERRIAGAAEAAAVRDAPDEEGGGFGVRFLATLCPTCMFQLEAGRASVVLLCPNCHSAWGASDRALVAVACEWQPTRAANVRFLPFWRSRVRVTGVALDSYADLVRVANLPVVAPPAWGAEEVAFWAPAFPTSPDQFLRLGRALTLMGVDERLEEGIPRGEWAPVTLAPEAGAAGYTSLLADFATPRGPFFDRIAEVEVEALAHTLVFLPFVDNGRELTRLSPPMTVGRNMVGMG